MQRSRRAFLHRRALEKAFGRSNLYRFLLSLVIVLLGLAFLLNLLISHGDVDRDKEESRALISFDFSSWDEERPESNPSCDSAGKTLFPLSGKNETSTVVSGSEEPSAFESTNAVVENSTDGRGTDRLTRTVPLGLDEFKSKALSSRATYVSCATGGIIQRMEPGGGKYNYASGGKGAKLLDSNKEAKGASNILNKDKDKYLRNPCSAEEKFVVIELSEETLVDTIEIANFEHYSANLKDFELLGSLVYPTSTWDQLGNFSAGNVKHAQTFTLPEPKWVRYLKLKIVSHYGSEFYCTLSSIEVYGIDAVERMLEDLISIPDNHHLVSERESGTIVLESSQQNNHDQNASGRSELTINTVLDPVEGVRHQQVSRMPGDTVLKILMQKVRALDLSLSVLERYLEEVNIRYGSIFKEFDTELEKKDVMLENITSDMKSVINSKDLIAKDVDDLMAWRSLVDRQLDGLLMENAMLRSDVRKVRENQLYVESKGIFGFLISIIFGFLAVVMLCKEMVSSVYSSSEIPKKFCCVKSSWFFLVLSSSTTLIILSL